jgi:non-canonical (house-cleaning) NTP pyrophosphatase
MKLIFLASLLGLVAAASSRIIVCSKAEVKLDAVRAVFFQATGTYEIEGISTNSGINNQPFGFNEVFFL